MREEKDRLLGWAKVVVLREGGKGSRERRDGDGGGGGDTPRATSKLNDTGVARSSVDGIVLVASVQ